MSLTARRTPVVQPSVCQRGRTALSNSRGRLRKLISASFGPEGTLERNVSTKAVATEAPPPQTASADRLEPRVEKRDGFWVVKEAFRDKLNPMEKMKIVKDPMREAMAGWLEELAAKPFEEIDQGPEGKLDLDKRLIWMGFFHRRKQQYGRFMMRLKIPNGVTNSNQVRFLAGVIEKYGEEGCADITTRQVFQIRGVQLKDGPEILKGMHEVGFTSLQAGMDNVRNAVGNPLAGVDPHEIIDTRPFNIEMTDVITNQMRGNPDYANLPRKWNVCVVGSHELFEHPHINDLAYIPAVQKDPSTGEDIMGFNILVGGFFSSKRDAEAIPLDAWVSTADVVPLMKAVLETFRDLGARANRQKARMMWLIDELGMDVFRAEVASRMPGGALQAAAEKDLIDPDWVRRDYIGVHPQKQKGLNFVGLNIPVGRLQAAEMFELARIADEYGTGEMRLTVEQNLILVNVPDENVGQLLEEPLIKGKFSPFPGKLMHSLVACTGNQFCGQAIIETKNRALKVTEELERTLNLPKTVRMHWTGCPNSCGQVQVADIGFMGCMARDENKKPVEGVDIYLGGKVGLDFHLGEVYKARVPCKDLVPAVQQILIEKFGASLKQT